MPDVTRLGLFVAAALILAITPGPGIFYVLTRSLKGGRAEGLASSFGAALGGFAHVLAAALGLSALLATSATAFAIIKYVGAAYLVYLGWRALRQPDTLVLDSAARSQQTWRAFTQDITTEIGHCAR